jgi:hypothetical protein
MICIDKISTPTLPRVYGFSSRHLFELSIHIHNQRRRRDLWLQQSLDGTVRLAVVIVEVHVFFGLEDCTCDHGVALATWILVGGVGRSHLDIRLAVLCKSAR